MNPCGLEPRLTAFKRSRSMIAASGYEPTPPIGKQHYYIGARRLGAFLRWAMR